MGVHVQWSGLEQFKTAMRNLPADQRRDGMAIIQDETEGAADEIRAAYPDGPTGNMKRKVKTEFPSSTVLAGIVRSTSPESHLYEFGTQVRRTAKGANRGAARPHPVTIPIARKHRRSMVTRLVEMVKAEGFEVSGDGV